MCKLCVEKMGKSCDEKVFRGSAFLIATAKNFNCKTTFVYRIPEKFIFPSSFTVVMQFCSESFRIVKKVYFAA